MTLDSVNLCKFANSSFGSGYLKPWKSFSMLRMIEQIPEMLNDRTRLGKYVSSCLEMEGFTKKACDEIAEFIWLDGKI